MSRSNPTNKTNPSTRKFEWRGSEGNFRYYDKEKKENVSVPLPFSFIPLDVLSGVSGYSDSEGSSIWSNHVKDISKQSLTVKTKSGVMTRGFYADISDSIKAKGGGFCNLVYIAYKTNDGLEIGTLVVSGSQLGNWFDFRKRHNLEEVAVLIDSCTEEKKGTNTYFVPVFKSQPISEEANEQAIELDKIVQEYLKRPETIQEPEEVVPVEPSKQEQVNANLGMHQEVSETPTAFGAIKTEAPEDDLPF